MSEPRCECCDLPIPSCGKAIEDARLGATRVKHRLPSTQYGIVANYPGTCNVCHDRFEAGDIIVRATGTLGTPVYPYAHEVCP